MQDKLELKENEIILYRASDSDIEPLECKCDKNEFGYPNRCTLPDGSTEVMYENTHFVSKTTAWDKISRVTEILIRNAGADVEQANETLLKYQKRAAEMAERYHKVFNNQNNPNKK